MAETSEPAKQRASLWPLLLTFVFLAIALYLGYLLWQKGMALAGERAAQAARLTALQAERENLKRLLSLEPCEAKSALSPVKSGVQRSGEEASKILPVADSGEAYPANVEDACVFIVSLAGPSTISTGSGFFVAPGYVATNKHVVGNSAGKIFVTGKGLGAPAIGRVVASSPDPSRDYALIKIDVPPSAKISTLNFAPDIRRTQKVGAWGFPSLVGKSDPGYARLLKGEDLSAVPELSYSEGVVSAVLNRDPQIIVHTAPISPGNSGGPLVNEKGELVGINTMISLDEDSYRQASIALAARDLENFLAAHGIAVRK